MLNIVSVIIGLVAIPLALVAFIPLLGWLNYLVIPIAIIGAGVGFLGSGTTGRNINIFVIIVGVIRLSLGGGIF
ncbi:MAG: hypothetical protein ABI667_00605 [Sphingomicrobium sp.]